MQDMEANLAFARLERDDKGADIVKDDDPLRVVRVFPAHPHCTAPLSGPTQYSCTALHRPQTTIAAGLRHVHFRVTALERQHIKLVA
jgi:hypothetical protein